MRLSPLDLRKQSFDTSLRGYSKDDVDAFLQMASEQWEEVLSEQRRLEEQVRSLEDKMEHYQRVEEALQEALQTARENAEQKLENAREKAGLLVQNAEARAADITREAREDREVLRRQVDQLQEQRGKVVARLRAFLMSEMELLLRFDGEDPGALRDALPEHLARHVTGPPASSEGASSSEGTSEPAQGEPAQHGPAPQADSFAPDDLPAESPERAERERAERERAETGGGELEHEEAERQKTKRRRAQRTELVSPPEASAEDSEAGGEPPSSDELSDFISQFEGEEQAAREPSLGQEEEPRGEEPAPDASAAVGASPSAEGALENGTSGEIASGDDLGEGDEGELGEGDEGEDKAPPKNVNALFASAEGGEEGDAGPAGEDITASSEEIDKIRRILNDME